MEVHLDPKEVLAHLNEMGYRNITPEQLRDFVRDLKKLIKYDVQHCKCENWHGGLCTTCSSRSATPSERPPLSSVNGTQHQPKGSKLSDDKKPTKTDASCREYTVTAEIKTGYPKSNKLKKPDSVKFEKENKIEIVEYTKPAPSFIKPWQLQRGSMPSRSDPVSLYHKYQTYWRQQKVPGEDSRAELRWRVREKMIGQDPHPRKNTWLFKVKSCIDDNKHINKIFCEEEYYPSA
ncbi:uncharacterized protein LOC126278543 isoform X1 [Schistocerca gregaria]|uniref:uncharacterized protein LOC126278543 isoform X1 n=1 Tax=Schistocerca gregaria TaxID=7010 RepID=UPI00211DE462|nr:uncharacterized protein LOC126278543 isoform X1 [Schistocerca gregaria]